MKQKILVVAIMVLAFAINMGASSTEPLKLIARVPLPGVAGDFDHFAVDLAGHRLFLASEEHHSLEVFDTRTNKHIKSVGGVDTPHSVLYLASSNKLFVVDGGDGTCKILDGTSYAIVATVKLSLDADSIAYDPAKKYLYIVNGGKEAGNNYSLISVVDTATNKRLADIKVDSANLEAMALENSGSRLFVSIRDHDQIGVIDRDKRAVLTTWPLDVHQNTPLALDESNHRLFVVGRNPGKLLVLDSESGKLVASLPSADGADDMTYDPVHKRIYVACAAGITEVYEQRSADHYELVGEVSTGFRAKTAILVPELNRYYVAVCQNGAKNAELQVFSVQNP
jgi:DNA-binding beta-propeller fold protein YncE